MPAPVAQAATPVGPISLQVRADLVFAPHVAALFAGFTPSDAEATSHQLRLHVIVGQPKSSRREPMFVEQNGVLDDASSGWDALVHFAPTVTRAIFALRDLSEFGPAGHIYMAKWVAGAVRVALALTAPRVDGLLLHGAALASGDALLGPSGAGKTTLARRLGAVSDDAVLVYRRNGWRLTGTPVPGREALPRQGASTPLRALLHLAPSEPLGLSTLTEAPALAAILQRIHRFSAPDAGFFALVHDLVRAVPSRRLASQLDDDVAPLLAKAA